MSENSNSPPNRKFTAADPYESLSDDEIYCELEGEFDIFGVDSIGDGDSSGVKADLRKTKYVLGEGYLKTTPVGKIEAFVKAVQCDQERPFEQVRAPRVRTRLKRGSLAKFLVPVFLFECSEVTVHDYSEEVMLVERALQELGIQRPLSALHAEQIEPMTKRPLFQLFNELVDKLRQMLRDPAYAARRRVRRERARRNYKSGKQYICKLFDRHKRLLVLRIDLGYRDWMYGVNNLVSRKTFQDMRRDLSRLLNNRRSNKLFEHMAGYIAKIEHGTTRGFHAHLLLFFNGDRRQRDVWLAHAIGNYWAKVITDGEGLYFNCNRHKNRYRRLGIGRVERGDMTTRANLLLALAYLTKVDQYLRVTENAGRTFMKGEVKERSRATSDVDAEAYDSTTTEQRRSSVSRAPLSGIEECA